MSTATGGASSNSGGLGDCGRDNRRRRGRGGARGLLRQHMINRRNVANQTNGATANGANGTSGAQRGATATRGRFFPRAGPICGGFKSLFHIVNVICRCVCGGRLGMTRSGLASSLVPICPRMLYIHPPSRTILHILHSVYA